MLLEDLKYRLKEAGYPVTQRDDTTPEGAAWFLGLSVGRLRNLRSAGRGPRAHRLKRIWYPLEGLLDYLLKLADREAA